MTSHTIKTRLTVSAAIALALTPLAVLSQQESAERADPPGLAHKIQTAAPAIASGEWTGTRLPDGQPDVQGHYSNRIANHNNVEDPQGGGRRAQQPRSERAPSRVTDPADGVIPYQPWARAIEQEFAANFDAPTEEWHVEPLARCAPAGVPKSFYWHGFEIRQYPERLLLFFNSGARVIYLDGRPHLPENVKLWNADSVGRWEGNTLIVDVRNNNSKALFDRAGNFASENVQIEERYVFNNEGTLFNYVATFTDPTVYTRPWTATVPMRRYTEADGHVGWDYEVQDAKHDGDFVLHERAERICVENNGGFGNPVPIIAN